MPVSHILIKEIAECMISNIKGFLLPKTTSYMLCKKAKFQLILGSYRLPDEAQPMGHAPPPPLTRFSVLVKLLARKVEVSVSHIWNS